MTNKLTFKEYEKIMELGYSLNGCAACGGPQHGERWCPCNMNILNTIIPEDVHLVEESWVQQRIKFLEEREKRIEEEQKKNPPEPEREQGSFPNLAEFLEEREKRIEEEQKKNPPEPEREQGSFPNLAEFEETL